VDTMSFEVIDTLLYPGMPDPLDRSGGAWNWEKEHVTAFEQIDPHNAHGEGFLHFPYALAVYKEQEHVMSVVLEQTDYRQLSYMSKVPLSELQHEKHSLFSPLTIGLYHSEGHLDLGVYLGSLAKEEAFEYLLDIVFDYLDLWDDPEYLIS
jgi:hypothetical protein